MLGKYIEVRKRIMPLAWLALLSLLGGCATSVVVKGNFPEPLVDRLPLNGSLTYTEEFKNYVYNESREKRILKSLDFTDAQIIMFDQVFGSLMTLVEADAPNRHLTIEPEILEMQYTAPDETKLNQYEVWIKYRIKLFDGQNEKLADWIIKGYGKTPTALLGSAASGFNSAANIALRDVGAQLAIGFPRQSKIKALIQGDEAESSEPVSEPAQEVTARTDDDEETQP